MHITRSQDDVTAVDVLLMADLAPHCIVALEVAPEIAAALQRRHPATSLLEAVASMSEGQEQLLRDTTAAMGEAVGVCPAAHTADGGSAAPGALADDVHLLFEMPDPGQVMPGAGRAKGRQQQPGSAGEQPTAAAAPVSSSKQRRRRSEASKGDVDEVEAHPVQPQPAQQAGAASGDATQGQQRSSQQPCPAGTGLDSGPVSGPDTAVAPDGLRAPRRAQQHLGKRAMTRRVVAFRRALAFDVLLMHRRFLEHLVAGSSTLVRAGQPEPATTMPAQPEPAAQHRGAAGSAAAVQPGGAPPALPTARPRRAAAATARRRIAQQSAQDTCMLVGDQGDKGVHAEGQPDSTRAQSGEHRLPHAQPDDAVRPPPKRRRTAAAAGAGQSSQGDSGAGSSWDPLEHRAWHPAFDLEAATLGALRSAARQHAAWLAGQLKLELVAAAGGGDPASGGGSSGGQQPPAAPPRVVKRHERCSDSSQLEPLAFLDHLAALPWYDGQLVHRREVTARPARRGAPAATLAPQVVAALASRGIHAAQQPSDAAEGSEGVYGSTSGAHAATAGGSNEVGGLFIHQAAAIDALLLRRSHTAVCTATASGKSVCYNVPVLQALAQDSSATALYMFPTKVKTSCRVGIPYLLPWTWCLQHVQEFLKSGSTPNKLCTQPVCLVGPGAGPAHGAARDADSRVWAPVGKPGAGACYFPWMTAGSQHACSHLLSLPACWCGCPAPQTVCQLSKHVALSRSHPSNHNALQTYDGDTPQAERANIRSGVQLLITNPDMLHQAILPTHASFARLLGNLRCGGGSCKGVSSRCKAHLCMPSRPCLPPTTWHSQPACHPSSSRPKVRRGG